MPFVRVVISGHVQGVGFRAFVHSQARALGCVGEVWNRADRRVEAIVGHPRPEVLDTFCKNLWNGPGHVSEVERFEHPGADYDRFEIGLTR